MKRFLLFAAVMVLVQTGCSPVLNRNLMDTGVREFQLSHLVETPEVFKDHLFILGGVIVDTKLTEKGSQIEALFIPVNGSGYLKDYQRHQGRFLAVYSRSKGILDPMIYKKGREITLAGDFMEVRKGKIDEMEYPLPGLRDPADLSLGRLPGLPVLCLALSVFLLQPLLLWVPVSLRSVDEALSGSLLAVSVVLIGRLIARSPDRRSWSSIVPL